MLAAFLKAMGHRHAEAHLITVQAGVDAGLHFLRDHVHDGSFLLKAFRLAAPQAASSPASQVKIYDEGARPIVELRPLASIVVAAIVQRREEIKSAGGYLRVLTTAGREFSLDLR
ncbi:MAG: replication initiation protein RepC [Methylocystis sp.]|uniref:replication initiation protein RepC n=1 Tax=Methylocystis sp. TaxID=1911079 RepID=UPI003DA37625